jgi:hypothetical protein
MYQINIESSFQQKNKISVKVEETIKEEGLEEIFYKTELDNFDSVMYEVCIRKSDKKKNYQLEFDMVHCFRYKFSQNYYKIDYNEPLGVEKFDNLSNAKSFKSKSLGIVINKDYKKIKSKAKIIKEIRIPRKKNNIIKVITYEDLSQKILPSETNKIEEEFPEIQEESIKFEKMNFSLMGNSQKMVLSEIECENEVQFNNSSKEIETKKLIARPFYVDNLFRKYGYEELYPSEAEQKKTKNSALCLFEIKSIYNKICGLFS